MNKEHMINKRLKFEVTTKINLLKKTNRATLLISPWYQHYKGFYHKNKWYAAEDAVFSFSIWL